MFPFHLNQAPSSSTTTTTTVDYMAGTGFQDDSQGSTSHPPSLSMAPGRAPPFPCPRLFNILHDQGPRHLQEEANDQSFNGATSRSCRLISRPQDDDGDDRNLKLSLCDRYVKEEEKVEVGGGGGRTHAKWMPSKVRIMRKMMNADSTAASRTRRQTKSAQDRSSGGANHVFGTADGNISPCGGDVVRVCSNCHTTKTPLWRSGPCGPKSLCNACGIRQRKARRAMAAAAEAAANGSRLLPSPAAPTKARKEKKPHAVVDDGDRTVPFKKRCKFADEETASTRAKPCFEDVTLTLGTSSTSSSTRRPFPQDERDAAILLMALSCGLVRS